MKMASNRKNNTSFTFTTFRAYEVKVPLFFRLEAVFMLKTSPEKSQLWQPRAPRVFDQMTSDQVHIGPEHVLYHLLGRWEDPFQMTRPSDQWGVTHNSKSNFYKPERVIYTLTTLFCSSKWSCTFQSGISSGLGPRHYSLTQEKRTSSMFCCPR